MPMRRDDLLNVEETTVGIGKVIRRLSIRKTDADHYWR